MPSRAKYHSRAGQLVTKGFTSPRRADGMFTTRLPPTLPRRLKRPPLERKEVEVVPANTLWVRLPFGQKGLREAAGGLVKILQVRFSSNPSSFRCLIPSQTPIIGLLPFIPLRFSNIHQRPPRRLPNQLRLVRAVEDRRKYLAPATPRPSRSLPQQQQMRTRMMRVHVLTG